jgi:hypothetical protein
MAYVYLVTGSEDGIIGAYGSRGRAMEAAENYASMQGKDETAIENNGPWVTYVYKTSDTYRQDTSATVEKFEVE